MDSPRQGILSLQLPSLTSEKRSRLHSVERTSRAWRVSYPCLDAVFPDLLFPCTDWSTWKSLDLFRLFPARPPSSQFSVWKSWDQSRAVEPPQHEAPTFSRPRRRLERCRHREPFFLLSPGFFPDATPVFPQRSLAFKSCLHSCSRRENNVLRQLRIEFRASSPFHPSPVLCPLWPSGAAA